MHRPPIFLSAVAIGLCSVAWAEDTEQRTSLDRVPPAVAQALKHEAGKDRITSISKETEKGRTTYEGTFKREGRTHDVTVAEDGKLLSDEETIPTAELPEVIHKAIEREHAGGKIEKAERITEGKKTSFEALVSSAGNREEIKFDSKGKVVEREKKRGKE